MKTILRSATVLAVASLLLAAPLLAQTGVAPAAGEATQKFAFVNFALVLEGTEEAKLEISNVRSFIDGKSKEFEAQTAELEKLKQQFAQQENSLNPQTRNEMQATIQEKEKNLRRYQEDTQLEINKKRDALFARLTGKVQPILGEYAQQKNLSAIFFLDSLQGYFDPGLDITQEVIRLYNERYPVQAPSQD